MSEDIIEALKELQEDQEVSRSMKSKLDSVIQSLQTTEAENIKLNRVMHSLEELGDDTNLQPLTRTALLSVLSLIESRASALR